MSKQKDIGTGFEYRVASMINELAAGTEHGAKRIWYSGAGLRKPYDVEVRRGRRLIMTIEAKRSIHGKAISVQLSWLKQITRYRARVWHVIVFACGNYRGREIPVYVIYRDEAKTFLEKDLIVAKPGKKSVSINQKRVDRPDKGDFAISAAGHIYHVVSFAHFLVEDAGYNKKEATC